MPLVFIRSERDAIYRAGKVAFVSGCMIVEKHLYRMIVELVTIDQHHGPMAVRTLDRVSGDQDVPSSVGDVARGSEEFMRGTDGLDPLFRDQLGRHVLRRLGFNVVVFVD